MSLHRRRILAFFSFALLATGCWILRTYSPSAYSFYPRCPVFTIFHLLCPGCGGTRALHALLRGHWGDALVWNPLIVLLLPFFLGWGLVLMVRMTKDQEFTWPIIPMWFLRAVLVLSFVFMLIRNSILPLG